MAVYVHVHWFNEVGQNIAIEDFKVTDTYSRHRMETSAKNYRFDDLWINRNMEDKIREYIYKNSLHQYFTAVVIDDILLDDVFVPAKDSITTKKPPWLKDLEVEK